MNLPEVLIPVDPDPNHYIPNKIGCLRRFYRRMYPKLLIKLSKSPPQ